MQKKPLKQGEVQDDEGPTTTTTNVGTDGVGQRTDGKDYEDGRLRMKTTTIIRTGREIGGSGATGPGVGSIGQIETGTRDIQVLAVMVSLILRSENIVNGVGVGLLQRAVQVIEGNHASVTVIHLRRDIVPGVHWMMKVVTLGCMITGGQRDIVVGNAFGLRDPDDTPFLLHLTDVHDPRLCRPLKVQMLENGKGLGHQSMH